MDDHGVNQLGLSATLHCLTGCAIGEVVGVVIGTALGWSNGATIALAIVLAFIFGYSLTTCRCCAADSHSRRSPRSHLRRTRSR